MAGEIDLKARYLNVLARLLANPFACLIYGLLQRHQHQAQLNLFIRYEPMGQIIWRYCKPPAWVAFEGKPLLLAKMAIHLNHNDLRGLLYLQGYKEHDFIANKI